MPITALQTLRPELYERAWCSVPHPTLPLLATAHAKSVTVYSLSSLSLHSSLGGGHSRSVRTLAWKPTPEGTSRAAPTLVTGSFDSTAGLWRWEADRADGDDDSDSDSDSDGHSRQITLPATRGDAKEWEFILILEGHDSEIKSVSFSPSGAFLATCSRDKTVWIWEDIGEGGGDDDDDEWDTVAVLNEHEGDVKAVAWCPDVPGRNRQRKYSVDVLASASYDDTVRIWREDADGDWVCVAVLEGHTGTVWGLEWERKPRDDDKFPRLLSYSADASLRVWELAEDAHDREEGDEEGSHASLGGIPNTMRRSSREDWTCMAVLPRVHNREIYSASWSAQTGRIASTGSDGKLVVYANSGNTRVADTNEKARADAETDRADAGQSSNALADSRPAQTHNAAQEWSVVAELENVHGPFEVNHVTWSRRFDTDKRQTGQTGQTPSEQTTIGQSELGETDEMLITTGDDGMVKLWTVTSER